MTLRSSPQSTIILINSGYCLPLVPVRPNDFNLAANAAWLVITFSISLSFGARRYWRSNSALLSKLVCDCVPNTSALFVEFISIFHAAGQVLWILLSDEPDTYSAVHSSLLW